MLFEGEYTPLWLLPTLGVFLLALFLAPPLNAQEIALTFDDAPRADEHLYTGPERTKRLIEILARHNVQAAFFVNTMNFNQFGRKERIKAYADAGHIIANHSHSHPHLSKVPVADYLKGIDDAHEALKGFPTFKPWFRYPYLNEGKTTGERDQVRVHLKAKGYSNGYVTIDNYAYFINDLMQDALERGHMVHFDRACQMLVDLLWDGILYYDGVAKKHIGSVRHVLLMHENDLEAHCLDKLIGHLQKKGWKIISPTRAFEDPLLVGEPDTMFLNQGRVAAVAHVRSGIKYVSKWEEGDALRTEFARRRIVK